MFNITKLFISGRKVKKKNKINRLYEVAPQLCPECGEQMRIISFIEDYKVIDKIISHLKLTFEAERPPPPHIAQHELLMAAEEQGEYF